MTLKTPQPTHRSECNKKATGHLLTSLLGVWLGMGALSAFGNNTGDSQGPISRVNPHTQTVTTVADQLWEWAELGYLETQSSALLQKTLADAGFDAVEVKATLILGALLDQHRRSGGDCGGGSQAACGYRPDRSGPYGSSRAGPRGLVVGFEEARPRPVGLGAQQTGHDVLAVHKRHHVGREGLDHARPILVQLLPRPWGAS